MLEERIRGGRLRILSSSRDSKRDLPLKPLFGIELFIPDKLSLSQGVTRLPILI